QSLPLRSCPQKQGTTRCRRRHVLARPSIPCWFQTNNSRWDIEDVGQPFLRSSQALGDLIRPLRALHENLERRVEAFLFGIRLPAQRSGLGIALRPAGASVPRLDTLLHRHRSDDGVPVSNQISKEVRGWSRKNPWEHGWFSVACFFIAHPFGHRRRSSRNGTMFSILSMSKSYQTNSREQS